MASYTGVEGKMGGLVFKTDSVCRFFHDVDGSHLLLFGYICHVGFHDLVPVIFQLILYRIILCLLKDAMYY